MPTKFATFFIVCLCSWSVQAQEIKGHLKVQGGLNHHSDSDIHSVFGESEALIHSLDGRVVIEKRAGPFSLNIDGEALGIGGDDFKVDRQLAALQGRATLPRDDRRLFDLTAVMADSDQYQFETRIDRLNFGYSFDKFVVKFGRQAVSWGSGLVFSAFDLFNPFSPIEIDKDYKTGDDLLLAQYVISNISDLQILVVPRRAIDSETIREDESSFAGKLHIRAEKFDFDLGAARHFGQELLDAGLSHQGFGGIFRLDVSQRVSDQAASGTNLVANYDRSLVVLDKNIYGYLEYFHSGDGEVSGDYLTLNESLIERLSRGEIYTLGRDYLTLGAQIEWTPLVNNYWSFIQNLNDSSNIVQSRAVMDLGSNFYLTVGVNLPFGRLGSEFGGVPLPVSFPQRDSVYLRNLWQLYTKLAVYF